MNSKVALLVMSFLVMSCSPLRQESLDPDMLVPEQDTPLTRSGEPSLQADYSAVTHFFQTDHRMILIQHVERRDSMFVQSLTEEDMAALNITEDEQAFSNAYVVQLNELIKHQ